LRIGLAKRFDLLDVQHRVVEWSERTFDCVPRAPKPRGKEVCGASLRMTMLVASSDVQHFGSLGFG